MNGEYIFTQTPGATAGKFPRTFSDYPDGVESFDVYSPLISQLYSQVFWKGLPPVDLPADIVKKYAGKGMAVVGFEMDQVRRTTDGDISVPINVVYNHHFESNMIGAKAKFELLQFDSPDDPRIAELEEGMAHGIPSHEEAWVIRSKESSTGLPTSQAFGGANGGEYRLSYHGYAPGYAQVIESPTQFQITPMQIDTWNRDHMNLTGPTKFVVGPLPRSSLAPSGPDALYSGLLECPLTTRVRKDIDADYVVVIDKPDTTSGCEGTIDTQAECFEAAATILGKGSTFKNSVVKDPTRPPGCSVTADAKNASVVYVIFNDAQATVGCGDKTTTVAGQTVSLVTLQVELDVATDTATISLTGPSDVWFGVGFNASAMKDAPWAVIVEASGDVSERKLADQNPGSALASSVVVVSSTVQDGKRHVVLTRSLKGKSKDYFTFDPTANTQLPFINAVGSTPTLSYHKDKSPSSLSLIPVAGDNAAGACICASKPSPFGQGKGKFVYVKNASQPADVGSGTVSFGNTCAPQPRSDLLAMKNPTCDVRSYVGGQLSCHHMWSLLDADQDIPWADQPLEYHIKFRFYVQEYNASYHTSLRRDTWGIASPVEYDVPKCEAGMMGCSRSPDGSWVHTIKGTYKGSGSLVAAHFHCHAPTCLSVAMYRCPNDVKECNETTGELLCVERPVYGGTGHVVDKRFDEPGYILQPPCLWGDAQFGLEAPPSVDPSKYTLHTVKTSNATYGHHGEMCWQQMYVI